MSDVFELESFFDPLEANLLRAFIESRGLFCYLSDENTIGIIPFYATALGGIKLFVREEDKQLALLLKTEFYQYEAEVQIEEAIPNCPNCGSNQVVKLPDIKNSYYHDYRCFDCDFNWDNRSENNINSSASE